MSQIQIPQPVGFLNKVRQPLLKANEKQSSPSPLLSLFAGATAGAVEAATTYPFEFAKTRLQLQKNSTTVPSRNPFSLLVSVARHEGLQALYVGCTSLVVGTAAKAGVRFLAFDTIKSSLRDRDSGKLSASRGILAGMLAGAAESILAVTPTERLKTALIDDGKGANKKFRNGFHAAQVLVRERGVLELYRGLVSTTLKQSGTSAVRMGTYNILRETFNSGGIRDSPVATFTMGAIAGVVTVFATQPLDTIKTRAQSAAGASTMEALRGILREAGPQGLWKGSTMRLGRLILSGGIVFSVYEQVVDIFSPSRLRQSLGDAV